jgi:NAD(P)-dependent dehydrogenase (short-subunit alcohol dehydrogenase family)
MKHNLQSLFGLSNKVAVVTGAGSGLGRAMAEAMAEAGAAVACLDINRETAKKTSDEIRKLNVRSIHVGCDVSEEKEVESAFQLIEGELKRVDILFNNAGISEGNENVHTLSLDDWNRVIGINLTGIFLCARQAVRLMLKQKGGKIINTGSIWAFRGSYPLMMVPPYHAAKAAVVSLTQEMALEYAKDKINVNAIIPGFFATNISDRMKDEDFQSKLIPYIPLGKVGRPEDVKGAALFLASPASDYLTGSMVVIDGGYLCR